MALLEGERQDCLFGLLQRHSPQGARDLGAGDFEPRPELRQAFASAALAIGRALTDTAGDRERALRGADPRPDHERLAAVAVRQHRRRNVRLAFREPRRQARRGGALEFIEQRAACGPRPDRPSRRQ